MNLYILRHGQTDGNLKKVLQGRADIPLNEVGRAQAREAGKELKKINFHEVCVSPLSRAVETACIATGKQEKELVICPDLIEISFGEMEGKCIEKEDTEFAKFFSAPEEYVAEKSAESYESMLQRGEAFLEQLKERYKGEEHKDTNVLVVSHGAMIHGLILLIRKAPLKELWDTNVANCAVTIAKLENQQYEIVALSEIEDRNYLERE